GGKRCTGVRYSVAGDVREVRAGREVVVSAGTINSPQLLELSGIGQPERLRNLGSEARQELPGVGENLRDHYFPRTRWLVGKKGITFNDRGRGLGLAQQVLHYALFRQGMLAMNGAPIRAFVCSREGLEAPDLMLDWIPMLTEPSPRGPRISRQSGLTLYAHAMRPESKGHVHITAADARRPPAINFNFLSSPPDAELTVRAVRIAREIMTAPAMTPFQVSELAPGANRTTDDEILDWVKQAAETTYHPVGTCKMGSDPMAVVDAQLHVHGIAGLRVADASIMPTLTSGNTNAPSIMIGEKAADMVLNAATCPRVRDGIGIGVYNVHLIARAMDSVASDEHRSTASALTSVRSIGTAFGAAIAGVVANIAGLGDATEPGPVGHAVTAVYMFCCIPFGLAALLMFRFVRITFGKPALAGERRDVSS